MIVVDASAIVDALIDRPAYPQLLATLADDELLRAPSLLDFKVASALRDTPWRGGSPSHGSMRR